MGPAKEARATRPWPADWRRPVGTGTTPLSGLGGRSLARGGSVRRGRRTVHQTLLENVGPKLYDTRLTQSEVEQKVRLTLQEVLLAEDTPLTLADRTRLVQEIADDILGYGRWSPYLRDVDVTEVMAQWPGSDLRRACWADSSCAGSLHRRGSSAAHHRQDRRWRRPPLAALMCSKLCRRGTRGDTGVSILTVGRDSIRDVAPLGASIARGVAAVAETRHGRFVVSSR